MKRSVIAAGVVAVVAGVLPSHAATALVCTFEAPITVSPGVSMEPTTSEFTTDGQTGMIDCVGQLRGADVTGTGTIGFEGRGGHGPVGPETCVQDYSTGAFEATIPTTDGDVTVDGLFTAQRGLVAGAFSGTARNVGPIDGVFEFQPAEGQDCVTTPVTEATVTGQAAILG